MASCGVTPGQATEQVSRSSWFPPCCTMLDAMHTSGLNLGQATEQASEMGTSSYLALLQVQERALPRMHIVILMRLITHAHTHLGAPCHAHELCTLRCTLFMHTAILVRIVIQVHTVMVLHSHVGAQSRLAAPRHAHSHLAAQ
eukprot:scaffold53555_cov24-Tisochrysis_lutea.AAC.1